VSTRKGKTAKGTVAPAEKDFAPLGKLDPVSARVREALALLYDAPERLINAVAAGNHVDVVDVVSCINGALGELRCVYDDRVDRFVDGRGGAGIDSLRDLHKIADLTARWGVTP
jgi:hypothetical protein